MASLTNPNLDAGRQEVAIVFITKQHAAALDLVTFLAWRDEFDKVVSTLLLQSCKGTWLVAYGCQVDVIIIVIAGYAVHVECLHEIVEDHPLVTGHRQVQVTGCRIAVKLGRASCGQLGAVTGKYKAFIVVVITIIRHHAQRQHGQTQYQGNGGACFIYFIHDLSSHNLL